MKYLLVLAVVLVAFWIWRNNRRAEREAAAPPSTPRAAPSGSPSAMVACRHCGLHLPAAEAVTGAAGVYCCAEHRRLAEG